MEAGHGYVAVLLFATLAAAWVGTADAEEEPKVSKLNVGISVMLLGSIGFMMALFELTHCYRKTMAKYTWKAISATISIFSAVLIFQAMNGIVEAYVLEGASETFELIVSIIHFSAWFVTLQWVLAVITGVLPVKCFDPKFDNLGVMEARLKTFAILLGHITGFAAINCFAVFQQQVPRTFAATFLVAPFAWLTVYGLGRVTDLARERVALIGDNKKDKHEEMWDEETEETEDDVVGLAVSFCFVQCVRFVVGGTLPNQEGEEPDQVIIMHSDGQSLILIAVGWSLGIVEVVRVMTITTTFKRLTPQMKNVIAMTFSWCIFFGTDWLLSHNLFLTEQGMTKEVALALTVTVVALAMIFALELIQDMKHLDDSIESAIHAIVNAIGILIGFAWEKAFDVAVAEVSTKVDVLPAPLTKLLLAIGLAGMVVPAWYRHILPNIIRIEEEEEEARAAMEGSAEQIQGFGQLEAGQKDALCQPLLTDTHGEEAELVATLERYQVRLADLEKSAAQANALEHKNRELEESIETISKELAELQKLADMLAN